MYWDESKPTTSRIWWLMNIHLPPKFIFTRVQGRVLIISNIWKNKKCSKTPTRYVFSSLKICICHHSPTGSTSSGASMMLGTYGSACVYFHHRQHWLVVSTCFNPFPCLSQFQSSSQILYPTQNMFKTTRQNI